MAVLTAQGISRVAIALLTRRLTLPRTVTAIPGTEFAGANGDTITVRVPQPGAARIQVNPGDPLVADDVDEVPIEVTLQHIYNLKNITDQELSFSLEDFARQVTRVQTAAVAEGAEEALADVMNDLAVANDIEFAATASEDDTEAVILAAREYLGENHAPPDDRFFAVSSDIASRILSVDKFSKVNESGSSDALRNAVIGRLYGFTFVESNALDAGTAVAYHRSAFAFATMTPVTPRGATSSSTAVEQGIGLRQIFQYDPGHAQDQSLVSTFAGAGAVYEDPTGTENLRFVKIGTGT